jgi:hypothetical protein
MWKASVHFDIDRMLSLSVDLTKINWSSFSTERYWSDSAEANRRLENFTNSPAWIFERSLSSTPKVKAVGAGGGELTIGNAPVVMSSNNEEGSGAALSESPGRAAGAASRLGVAPF